MEAEASSCGGEKVFPMPLDLPPDEVEDFDIEGEADITEMASLLLEFRLSSEMECLIFMKRFFRESKERLWGMAMPPIFASPP